MRGIHADSNNDLHVVPSFFKRRRAVTTTEEDGLDERHIARMHMRWTTCETEVYETDLHITP